MQTPGAWEEQSLHVERQGMQVPLLLGAYPLMQRVQTLADEQDRQLLGHPLTQVLLVVFMLNPYGQVMH